MYTFIVNPNARSGLGHKVWNELETILKKENVAYQVFFTKYRKHATEITHKITSDGNEHIVVALGGDGTVNEVVNGIVNIDKTTLGYIPIGSSNDFARGHAIPKDAKEALRVVLTAPKYEMMNIGQLEYRNVVRRFAVSTGFGFDAGICHEVVVSHLKKFLNKLGLGKLTYVGVALHHLFVCKPCTVKLILDGEKEITYPKTLFVATMNSKFEGGGAKFCPKANAGDDKLDLCIISNIPKLKALMLIPTAFMGCHTIFKGVYTHTCKTAELHADAPQALHTDGEPLFIQRDTRVSCLPEKLRLIIEK